MAAKRPSFQFYPQDFLSDMRVQAMEPEELGAYIKLLCHDWIEGGLPDDDKLLAKLSGAREKWDSIKMAVLSCFEKKDGKIFNPRLRDERKKQDDYANERAESGKNGAKSRWSKKKQEIAEPCVSHETANSKPMANDGFSSSSSIITTTPKPPTETAAAAEVIWEQPTKPPHTPERLSRLAKSAKVELSEIFPAAVAMTIPQVAHLIVAVQEKKAGKKIAKPVAVALHRERSEPPPAAVLKLARRYLDPAPPKKSPCPDCGQIIEDGYCNSGPWMRCPGCGKTWEP